MSWFFNVLIGLKYTAIAVFTKTQNALYASISNGGETVTWTGATLVTGEIIPQDIFDGNEYGYSFTIDDPNSWFNSNTIYVGVGDGDVLGGDVTEANMAVFSGPDVSGDFSFLTGSPILGLFSPGTFLPYAGEIITISVQSESPGNLTTRVYTGSNSTPIETITLAASTSDRISAYSVSSSGETYEIDLSKPIPVAGINQIQS